VPRRGADPQINVVSMFGRLDIESVGSANRRVADMCNEHAAMKVRAMGRTSCLHLGHGDRQIVAVVQRQSWIHGGRILNAHAAPRHGLGGHDFCAGICALRQLDVNIADSTVALDRELCDVAGTQ